MRFGRDETQETVIVGPKPWIPAYRGAHRGCVISCVALASQATFRLG
jgi:hypothetical protein